MSSLLISLNTPVSQTKSCHCILDDNLNMNCLITIIFGTLINQSVGHWMVVSTLATSPIQCNCLTLTNCLSMEIENWLIFFQCYQA